MTMMRENMAMIMELPAVYLQWKSVNKCNSSVLVQTLRKHYLYAINGGVDEKLKSKLDHLCSQLLLKYLRL